MTLAEAVKKRIGNKTYREAARALCLDSAYLYRMANGESANPSDSLLAALGIKKTVEYSLLPDYPAVKPVPAASEGEEL